MPDSYYLSWYQLFVKSELSTGDFYLRNGILSGECSESLRVYLRRGKHISESLGLTEEDLKNTTLKNDVIMITKRQRTRMYLLSQSRKGEQMKQIEKTRAFFKAMDEKLKTPGNQEKCLEWYSAFIRSGLEVNKFTKDAESLTGIDREIIFNFVNNGCMASINRNLSNEELLKQYKKIIIREAA